MKLLAVIVAFHPDPETLKRNIGQFIDYVDQLILWDNSPDQSADTLKVWLDNPKIEYMTSGKNEYIAYALNQAIDYGVKNGFSHLLTMDQDSCFVGNTFGNYRTTIERSVTPAIYGPAVFADSDHAVNICNDKKIITSGMVIDLQIPQKIGKFSEKYQIDYVDFEYVLRVIKAGVATKIIPECQLMQHFGSPQKKVCGTAMNYSAVRLYFQTRNRMWLRRQYQENAAVAGWFSVNFKLMIKILLYERKKLTKIWAIFRGTRDGLFKF